MEKSEAIHLPRRRSGVATRTNNSMQLPGQAHPTVRPDLRGESAGTGHMDFTAGRGRREETMLWRRNVGRVIADQQFAAMPQCTNTQFTISGFPEYEVSPEKLPEEQQHLITRIADQVVASFASNTPFVAFSVKGHADRALRKPVEQREEFERGISQRRAQAAESALLSEIARLGRGTPQEADLKLIEHRAIGVGSTERLMENPRTESEMRLNRRVEIFLAQCAIPPTATLEQRVNRLLDLLKTRRVEPDSTGTRTDRARCILPKMLKPDVVDVFVDGTASNQQVGRFFVGEPLCGWNGNYDPPPLSQADFLKFLATVKPILMGPGFDPLQSDDAVLRVLGDIVLRIDLGVERVDAYVARNSMLVDPITGAGYAGDQTRKKLQSLYRDHLDEENNIYSCYR
jgi:hypothetical protein